MKRFFTLLVFALSLSGCEDILNSENESEYLQQYAREELDYVMPGERVYANSAT